jgi:hypothetical protein
VENRGNAYICKPDCWFTIQFEIIRIRLFPRWWHCWAELVLLCLCHILMSKWQSNANEMNTSTRVAFRNFLDVGASLRRPMRQLFLGVTLVSTASRSQCNGYMCPHGIEMWTEEEYNSKDVTTAFLFHVRGNWSEVWGWELLTRLSYFSVLSACGYFSFGLVKKPLGDDDFSLQMLSTAVSFPRPSCLCVNLTLMPCGEFLREFNNCSATKEFPTKLWNPIVHYLVHNSPPLILILSEINLVHIL